MRLRKRIAAAFLLAPLAAILSMMLLGRIGGKGFPSLGFLYGVAVVAYGVTLVPGIAAFLLTRPWGLRSRYSYGLVAAVVAAVPAAFFDWISGNLLIAAAVVVSGAVAGLVFGSIMLWGEPQSAQGRQG
jgi:hypothetical protein